MAKVGKIAREGDFFYFYLHICKKKCTFAPDFDYFEKIR